MSQFDTMNLSPEKRALLALMASRNSAANRPADRTPKLPRTGHDHFPLSFVQERFWFFEQLEPGNPAYNVFNVYRFQGPLNPDILEKAIQEIIKRHEVWRTTFQTKDGEPVQIVHPDIPFKLPATDLNQVPEKNRQLELDKIIREKIAAPFDLANGPLWRIQLIAVSQAENILVVVTHHIINDGTSFEIFLRELGEYYSALITNNIFKPAELPVQYVDFAGWQRESFQAGKFDKEIDYWREKLGGELPVLELPLDFRRPPVQTYSAKTRWFETPHPVLEKLRTFSQQEGFTLFMVLLAAFKALLYRYSGQTDLIVGTPIAGRTRSDIEPLIGCFINTLALRTCLDPRMSFRDLVSMVKETTLDAQAHQEIPFEILVGVLNPERSLSHSPLFQVMFNLQPIPPLSDSLAGLTVQAVDTDRETVMYDLSLSAWEDRRILNMALQYNTALFEDSSIGRMIGHFHTFLAGAAANPETPVADLPLLTPAEYQQIIHTWNSTYTVYPGGLCFHRLFENEALQNPEATAVIYEHQRCSYRELNTRANQLAHYLQTLGAGPETIVGVAIPPSVEMVIALLGILKAGGAYLPLDINFPKERLSFMIEDSNALVLLTQSQLQTIFAPVQARIIALDSLRETLQGFPESAPPLTASPDNLAYVIYTSGSTGQPKGVEIPHRAVTNFLAAMKTKPGIAPNDKLLAVTTLSFDIAVLEIFLPLSAGASVVVTDYETSSDGKKLMELMSAEQISMMQATPATWQILLSSGWQGDPRLKILCGGEALAPDLARQLSARASSLWNMYGPTETTIWSSYYEIKPEDDDAICIGKPIANTEFYILDGNLQPVPVGITGQLYIGGDGLSRGYHNRPELTAERFLPNPFSRKTGTRMYNTGDLARFRLDGNVEYIGRSDFQVKVRGFRIELGEIETALLSHPQIKQAVTVVREDTSSDKRIVAYYVPEMDAGFSQESIESHLRQILPEYMMPATLVSLETMPLTPNGKVNRKALPVPDFSRMNTEYAAPETEIEMIVAETWTELLRVEPIGINGNFFRLGGHSLLGNRFISRVRERFQIELPLRAIFERPVLKHIAAYIEEVLIAEIEGLDEAEIDKMLQN